jgi:TonB family protein
MNSRMPAAAPPVILSLLLAMITLARSNTKLRRRALKAGLASIIPGLGQLLNRRLDKALAFLVVDLANFAVISILLGARIPFIDFNTAAPTQLLSQWQPGTVPFAVLAGMMLAFMFYAGFDAFRDALIPSRNARKPEITLSHATCASYVMHLSAIYAICFLVLWKFTPQYHTELKPITLTFELEPPVTALAKVPAEAPPAEAPPVESKPVESNLGEVSPDKSAHSRDPQLDNELSMSSPGAEMNAGEEKSLDAKPSAEEKEAIASKQIITPDPVQSPREVFSRGASEKARQTTKKPDSETAVAESAPAHAAKPAADSDPDSRSNPDPLPEPTILEKPKLIAQLPPAAAVAGGVSPRVDESDSARAQAGGSNSAVEPTGVNATDGNNRLPVRNALPARAAAAFIFPGVNRASTAAAQFNRLTVIKNSPAVSQSTASQSGQVPAREAPLALISDMGAGGPYAGLQEPYVPLNLHPWPDYVSTKAPRPAQDEEGGKLDARLVVTMPVPADSNSRRGAEALAGTKAGVAPSTSAQGDKETALSMLGFMDSTLSNDPEMRLLWGEVSANLSRCLKETPLSGSGSAVKTFTLNRNGETVLLENTPTENAFENSLSRTLSGLPRLAPVSDRKGKVYFQVKALKDSKSTFISLEVTSQLPEVTADTLSDFKYQADLQSYLKGVKKAIYSYWQPPVQEGVKPVMIGFKITTEGIVSEQRVVQSCGDPRMDRAALMAALSVTRWIQPPAGTSEDLDVCMVIQKCRNCDGTQTPFLPLRRVSRDETGRIVHSTSPRAKQFRLNRDMIDRAPRLAPYGAPYGGPEFSPVDRR